MPLLPQTASALPLLDGRTVVPLLAAVMTLATTGYETFAAGDSSAVTNPSTTATHAATTMALPVVAPEGFVRVMAGGRAALCEPSDATWVRTVLLAAGPASRPTTTPSDLLARLRQQRDPLQTQLAAELALTDPAPAAKFIDDSLLPLVQRLPRLRVPLLYLILTQPDLTRIVKAGWGAQQFHYNRLADKVAFDGEVNASLDGVDGESIIPSLYVPTDPPEARDAAITAIIHRTETGVANMLANRSQTLVEVAFGRFVTEQGIAPLKLTLDQQWFGDGITEYLSAIDLSTLNDSRPEDLLQTLSQPSPENPILGTSIDLLHPAPPEQLRPEMAGAYVDAFRHRSTAIVVGWLGRAGADALPRVLSAWRASPPKDGPALLTLIKETTGIDLTAELRAL